MQSRDFLIDLYAEIQEERQRNWIGRAQKFRTMPAIVVVLFWSSEKLPWQSPKLPIGRAELSSAHRWNTGWMPRVVARVVRRRLA